MTYLPRKALEGVINVLRARTSYQWNVVYTGQRANNIDSMDEGYAEFEWQNKWRIGLG
jgi:hypothetical protein